jgi:cellulose synthase (UDP-forming)
MNLETASLPLIVTPLLLATAFYLVGGPAFDRMSRAFRVVVVAVTAVFLARYLHWRLTDTVLAATGSPVEIAWIWTVYGAEMITYLDAAILFLLLLKPTNRSAEADVHEARLRASDPAASPCVDVLIATYNEPLEVLEKTIVGALSLDYPSFKVWICDDGRRKWLRDYCAQRGVGYIIRADNKGAKAGNINHALSKVDSPFFAIFDADFVPQRSFLIRTMGFFADERVGVVQVPHTFYNNDPMQTNLSLRSKVPDDQRFFFETLMPCRDGWDVAFCCGSNSVTRRAAMRAVGDSLPEGSITEDILLSMALLQKGFVTRYLCEPLALGLAPESVAAFFVQRERWARGAIQTLFLKQGPLGGGRTLTQALFFLPTAWLTQSLSAFMTLLIPLAFLLFGLTPVANVAWSEALYYVAPLMVAITGAIVLCAPGTYFPVAQTVLTTLQSFKLLPTVLLTFVKPHGHVFKVTPKGKDAASADYQTDVFWAAAAMLALTVLGIVINMTPITRVAPIDADLTVAFAWAGVNIVVLLLVCMSCVKMPALRGEERIPFAEPVWIRRADGRMASAPSTDISVSGVGVAIDVANPFLADIAEGEVLSVAISEVGQLGARVMRRRGGAAGLKFIAPSWLERDLLLRKTFTDAHNPRAVTIGVVQASLAMLSRIVTLDIPAATPRPAAETAPDAPAAPEEKLERESLATPPWARGEIVAAAAARRFDAAQSPAQTPAPTRVAR